MKSSFQRQGLAAQAGRRGRRSVRVAAELRGAIGAAFVLLAARLATFERR